MIETTKKLRCVHAATDYYKVGQVYDVYRRPDGTLCVKGRDGFYDTVSTMTSKFTNYEEKADSKTDISILSKS